MLMSEVPLFLMSEVSYERGTPVSYERGTPVSYERGTPVQVVDAYRKMGVVTRDDKGSYGAYVSYERGTPVQVVDAYRKMGVVTRDDNHDVLLAWATILNDRDDPSVLQGHSFQATFREPLRIESCHSYYG